MKTIYTLLILTIFNFQLSIINSFAQTPGGVSSPLAWKKVASNGDSIALRGKGLTFIGVGKVQASDAEQTLWSIGTPTTTSFVQTTSRTANLSKTAFMNYANDTLPEMRMYSYSNTQYLSPNTQTMYIGRATDTSLPVTNLIRPFMEYVVYDRALSASERNRVETTLALRHGLTLKHSYLNSEGVIIWNYVTQKAFSHHVAGIIADTQSGLTRYEGYSAEQGGFLHVSMSKLTDSQSLLWGDDNQPLRFVANKMRGKWMQRMWKAQATNLDGATVNIAADSKSLQQFSPLAEMENYYLAVDPTGTAEFPVRSVRYYKATVTPDDSIRFASVAIDAKAAWSLRAEKDMFTTISVEGAGEKGGGVLDILITGGTAPFANLLKKDSTVVYNKVACDTLVTVTSLAEGRYQLTTTDKAGIQDVKEFDITPTGIRAVANGYADNADGIIGNITASPNPTNDGYVNVEIELTEASPITLTLFTSGGATVSSKIFPKDSYLYTKIYLPNEGVYLLKVESGQSAKTIKLIRK